MLPLSGSRFLAARHVPGPSRVIADGQAFLYMAEFGLFGSVCGRDGLSPMGQCSYDSLFMLKRLVAVEIQVLVSTCGLAEDFKV